MNTVERLIINFVLFSVLLVVGLVGGTTYFASPLAESGFSVLARVSDSFGPTRVSASSAKIKIIEPVVEEVVVEPTTVITED